MTVADVERFADRQWGFAAAVGLGGIGLGIGSPILVAAATLPLWFAAAAALGTPPVTDVAIERTVTVGGRTFRDGTQLAAEPGDVLTVDVAVRNASDRPLVDARIADDPPADLPLRDGEPRLAVTLDPGEATTCSYELVCRRGEYVFGEATVRTRDLTATVAATQTVPVTGCESVVCSPVVEDVPLGEGTNDYAGEVPTDEGGSGTEFYAVREYEPGDPVRSIDWRRYAATRDLVSVQYRAERSTRIVCVVDARPSQFLLPPDASLPAVELSADAARQIVETLSRGGHPTGVLTLTASDRSYVPPGTDEETRQQARNLLDGIRDAPGRRRVLAWNRSSSDPAAVARRLPGEAQVFLFSSLVDDAPVALTEHLRTRGYPVRVVSPDPTGTGGDLGTRLEALARETRLARLRDTGAHALDWQFDRPLPLVLGEAVGEVSVR